MTSCRPPELQGQAAEPLRRSSTRGAPPQTTTTSCSSSPPLQPTRLLTASIAEDGRSATRPCSESSGRACTSETSIDAVGFPGSGVPGGSRRPVLQCLADVFRADPLSSVQVGNRAGDLQDLSLIHISEPTRLGMISYAVFCL